MRRVDQWRWHMNEVFVNIRRETHDLWRAVDHEGEVLAAYVSRKRDKAAALKFLSARFKSSHDAAHCEWRELLVAWHLLVRE